MSQLFEEISDRHRAFIEAQKLFFVATATAEGRINLSPKGMDALRVLGPNRVVWLNLTGSGNESAAHVQVDPRMTLMLCAFEGSPMILRLYGQARAVHRSDADWPALSALFGDRMGARQVFDLAVESVQTSCGFAVPLFDYQGERDLLVRWADKKGEGGIRDYWAEKNQTSIDGLPTGIVEKNG
ncbi:MAG: pyridoxamine 5'-phosphate oxidase family protein [Rhodocyclaceae bacterium]|nr:pyridoxamine 5'-phosphate oxidase family protein [Rhodocyclaceae bacterium]